MPRLFVAVRPGPEVVALLSALDRPALPGVRWSTPEQWLVKLRPLGHVRDRVVGGAVAVPDHVGDDRHAPVRHHHDVEAVLERKRRHLGAAAFSPPVGGGVGAVGERRVTAAHGRPARGVR
jgi:hypothetical protein